MSKSPKVFFQSDDTKSKYDNIVKTFIIGRDLDNLCKEYKIINNKIYIVKKIFRSNKINCDTDSRFKSLGKQYWDAYSECQSKHYYELNIIDTFFQDQNFQKYFNRVLVRIFSNAYIYHEQKNYSNPKEIVTYLILCPDKLIHFYYRKYKLTIKLFPFTELHKNFIWNLSNLKIGYPFLDRYGILNKNFNTVVDAKETETFSQDIWSKIKEHFVSDFKITHDDINKVLQKLLKDFNKDIKSATVSTTSPRSQSITSPRSQSKTSPRSQSKTSPRSQSITSPRSQSKTSPRSQSITSPRSQSKTSPRSQSKTSPRSQAFY
jgi:hypothetical protein